MVTLNFDENLVSQAQTAAPLLAKHGFKATFYVNSCRIQGVPAGPVACPQGVASDPSYMNWSHLRALYAQGHEIGGHSTYHEIHSTAEAKRADICADRSNLMAQGFAVTSFAYPGDDSRLGQAVVAGCGYNSGRRARGLRSADCADCPFAGKIPPSDPYDVPTIRYIEAPITLADLQRYVTEADAHGGGWVPLVFSNVCGGCSITEQELDGFLGWLRTGAPAGTTVETTDQVIGGRLQPAVGGGGGPVAPRPGSGVGAAAGDTIAPLFASLSMTRRSFAVGRRSTARGARRGAARGTVIKYVLSEPSSVRFRIQRLVPGRRVGNRCSGSAASGRRCTLRRTVGTLARNPSRLTNRLAFSGRIGSRALRPGRYRLVATATDPAGNRSRPRTMKFAITRR